MIIQQQDPEKKDIVIPFSHNQNDHGYQALLDSHKRAQDIGLDYLKQFLEGNVKSYELELDSFPDLRPALSTLSMCNLHSCCSTCQTITGLIYATLAYGTDLYKYNRASLSRLGIC